VDVSKIEVIPISIPRRSANGAVKEKYFFYFGYMVRRKGLGFVLDGFKRFVEKYPKTTYNLVLAGGVIGGQERALTEIEEMISKNILQDRVWIRGFVDEKDLDGLYGKAEAVVIPAKVSMGSSGPLFHGTTLFALWWKIPVWSDKLKTIRARKLSPGLRRPLLKDMLTPIQG
jgi:glycosyltransferase involved in cell wall biosynthesis